MNKFYGLTSFLRRWDAPAPYAPGVSPSRSRRGNINVTGHSDDAAAYAFVPHDEAFEDAIENRIRPLVVALVRRHGLVTYSSCEGHPTADGARFRPAHVGILPRGEQEEERAAKLLGAVQRAAFARSDLVEVALRVLRGRLDTDDGPRVCIDLWFLNTGTDETAYFTALDNLLVDCVTVALMDEAGEAVGLRAPDPVEPGEASRRFTTPGLARGEGERLFHAAVARRATRITGEYLSRFGDRLPPGLHSALSLLPEFVSRHRREVHRALTVLSAACHAESCDVVAAGTQAALALSSAGVSMEFEAHFERSRRFGWRGQLFGRCDWVALSRASTTTLELAQHGHRRMLRADELSAAPGAVALPLLSSSQAESPPQIILPWATDVWPVLAAAFPLTTLPALEVSHHLDAGAALVRAASREFACWCDEALTDVVPVRGSLSQSASGSLSDAPGQFAVSVPASPAMVAELLVHESSHEHLHLLAELEPLHDSSDSTLYWSPVKKTGRPIDRILLAHHAFINILLFYEQLIASGLDESGYAATNFAAHRSAVEALEVALNKTTALTSAGRALYVPYEAAFAGRSLPPAEGASI